MVEKQPADRSGRWCRVPWVDNLGFLLGGTLLSRGLIAAAFVLLARHVGPEQYGLFAAGFSLAWLTSPLFSLGLDNWLVGPGARGGPASTDLAHHVWACLLLKAVGGGLWLVLLLLGIQLLNSPTFQARILLPLGAVIWMEELQKTVHTAFKATLENRINFVLMPLGPLLVVLSLATLAWRGIDDLAAYLVVWWGSSMAAALFALSVLVRRFGFPGRPRGLGRILVEAFPFALSGGLAMVYGRVDVALVAAVLGATAAGLYSPAVSLVNALALIPTVGYFVLLPLLNHSMHQDNQVLLRTLGQGLKLSVVGGVVLGGVLWFFAAPLVSFLYGSGFVLTGHLLAILSGVLVARTLSLALAAGLVALDRQLQRVGLQAFAAIFNILVNLLVLERWGLQGVAWVFVLTEALLALAYLALLHHALRRRTALQALSS